MHPQRAEVKNIEDLRASANIQPSHPTATSRQRSSYHRRLGYPQPRPEQISGGKPSSSPADRRSRLNLMSPFPGLWQSRRACGIETKGSRLGSPLPNSRICPRGNVVSSEPSLEIAQLRTACRVKARNASDSEPPIQTSSSVDVRFMAIALFVIGVEAHAQILPWPEARRPTVFRMGWSFAQARPISPSIKILLRPQGIGAFPAHRAVAMNTVIQLISAFFEFRPAETTS